MCPYVSADVMAKHRAGKVARHTLDKEKMIFRCQTEVSRQNLILLESIYRQN